MVKTVVNQGFSLIEVLVALALFIVTVCGASKLLLQAKQFEHLALEQEKNRLVLMEKTENLRAFSDSF